MDIAEISQRTEIELRKLRYIVDHKILDKRRYTGKDKLNTGRGVPRYFSDFGGFAVALAALFREAGLSRQRVELAMDFVFKWATSTLAPKKRLTLEAFMTFELAKLITLELGDGVNIRILVDGPGDTEVPVPESTEWTDILTGHCLSCEYVPLVRTDIAVTELARRFEG